MACFYEDDERWICFDCDEEFVSLFGYEVHWDEVHANE